MERSLSLLTQSLAYKVPAKEFKQLGQINQNNNHSNLEATKFKNKAKLLFHLLSKKF